MLLEVATCRIYDYGELRCLPKSDACIPGSLLNLESMQVLATPLSTLQDCAWDEKWNGDQD